MLPKMNAAALNAAFAQAIGPERHQHLDQQRLAQDFALLQTLFALRPPLPIAALPPANAVADRGFGLRLQTSEHDGGYLRWQLLALCNEEAALTLQLHGYGEEETVLAGMAHLCACQPTTPLTVAWEAATTEATIQATLQAALGVAPNVTVPAEVATAFDLLTSPFRSLIFGHIFGVAAQPPEGRVAVAQLENQPDLLRAVLRSPSPVGRIYAAEALLAQSIDGAIAPADALAINALRTQPTPVACCYGCTVLTQTAADCLPALMMDDSGYWMPERPVIERSRWQWWRQRLAALFQR